MHEIMKNDNLEEITDPHHFRSVDMIVYGHVFHIPSLMNGRRIASFTFHDLCEKPYGAADFIALGKIFHVIAIKDIPKLTINQRNAVSTLSFSSVYGP
jgi:predicted ATPase